MTDRAGTSGTYHAADCQAMFAQRDLRLQFVLSTARLVLNTRLLHPTLQCPADSQTDTLQQNNSRIRKARLGRHTAPGYWSTTAHHATGQPQRTMLLVNHSAPCYWSTTAHQHSYSHAHAHHVLHCSASNATSHHARI